MARFDYILAVTMAISLIWGIIILAFGAIIRFNFGKLIDNYVSGIDQVIPKESRTSPGGQDLAPILPVPDDVDLGSWTVFLGSFVILTGFIVTIFSALGFVAALKHSTPLIILFIVFCLVATGLQFYLVQIATSEDVNFHTDAKNTLKERLAHYTVGGTDAFSVAMNAIMFKAQCCGIESVSDFKNLTFIEKVGETQHTITFAVPPPCCHRSLFGGSSASLAYNAVKSCAIMGSVRGDNVYSKGCYGNVFRAIDENQGAAILGVLLFIIIWEMLQIVLGVLVKFTPPPKDDRKTGADGGQVPVQRDSLLQPKIKKFVPFSKVSSFTAADISRVKSTEIW
ncbi:uncharacterized protein LOC131932014 [Physella acuta]|uniref:uncharacterized protein LOC131932014 n=1 Tax=Physella acuta TaxID=109671 RepID=UPI0027DD2E81|nr:uncharacterized protein LOC131932014 [Physella acuta]